MDECSSKRGVGRISVPRKGLGLILKDSSEVNNRNARPCNRIGCSGGLSHTKSTGIGSLLEKPKSPRPPSPRSLSGKEIASSSKCSPSLYNTKKPFQKPQNVASTRIENDSDESSSVRNESEIHSGSGSKPRYVESSKALLAEAGSSSIAEKNGRGRKVNSQKSVMPNASSSNMRTRTSSGASGYGLRNLRCNSVSDVVPRGCSSESTNRKSNLIKKRRSEGESSSSTFLGKKLNGSSLIGGCSPTGNGGISISDNRQTRNVPLVRENGVSFHRTRRSPSALNGGRSSLLTPPGSQTEIHQFSSETSFSDSVSNCRSSSGDALSSTIPANSRDFGIARLTRIFNMDGIAEVLLALDRIEQDEELTYEQLLSLETNLHSGGFNFYDQHRDLRLDIDNMSYEELLALEDEMGIVGTGLSEEALSKCLRISTYQPSHSMKGSMGWSGDVDDLKCCICQEEYLGGDEIGKLRCEHGYHAVCVEQWLRLKNWCPICKASMEPSE